MSIDKTSTVGGDQPIGGPRAQKVEGDRFPSSPHGCCAYAVYLVK